VGERKGEKERERTKRVVWGKEGGGEREQTMWERERKRKRERRERKEGTERREGQRE